MSANSCTIQHRFKAQISYINNQIFIRNIDYDYQIRYTIYTVLIEKADTANIAYYSYGVKKEY